MIFYSLPKSTMVGDCIIARSDKAHSNWGFLGKFMKAQHFRMASEQDKLFGEQVNACD